MRVARHAWTAWVWVLAFSTCRIVLKYVDSRDPRARVRKARNARREADRQDAGEVCLLDLPADVMALIFKSIGNQVLVQVQYSRYRYRLALSSVTVFCMRKWREPLWAWRMHNQKGLLAFPMSQYLHMCDIFRCICVAPSAIVWPLLLK